MSFKIVAACAILIVIAASTSGQSNCACSRHLAPVCGTDGQVYSNKCVLECARTILRSDITVKKEGPCNRRGKRAAQSQCVCVRNSAPVCGTDGVIYSNICLLNCEREKNLNLELRNEGPCKRSK